MGRFFDTLLYALFKLKDARVYMIFYDFATKAPYKFLINTLYSFENVSIAKEVLR